MLNNKYLLKFASTFVIAIFILISCSEEDTLAPYVGPPGMSKLSLQTETTTPKINWVGGYVSVLGVNKGSYPALDSTLIWLIYQGGDRIKYPVKYGELPAGAQDITQNYGRAFLPEMIEDSSYSFWVMKEADWNIISSNQNKYLNLDSSITGIITDGDTINIPPQNYTQLVTPLDNYINITNLRPRGKLAVLSVEKPTTDNNPIISWKVNPGVTDTLISVIGLCNAGQFQPGDLIWEVYSSVDSGGITYYGKHNVIPGPLKAGDQFDRTFIFTEYPEGGLERDKTYFLYIANKDWDGEDYDRTAEGFCYIIFDTY